MRPSLTVAVPKGHGQRQRQLDAYHPTPGIQYISADPGPPPLGQYAPAIIPVRVVSPTPLPSFCTYSLSYRSSNYSRCPTITPLVTYLFLKM